MILSAQSIRRECTLDKLPDGSGVVFSRRRPFDNAWSYRLGEPLIAPFHERGIVNGKSFGLSSCTYDCRIADRLTLPVGQSRLAVTMEKFFFPPDICGSVLDKSSWARVFVSAFNTHLDPGWIGYLTVELVNLGTEVAEFFPGDPLCQIKFEWLDEATELPYKGKYQNQEKKPIGARNENSKRAKFADTSLVENTARRPKMRRVIVESPFAGQLSQDLTYARRALRDCLMRGEAPFASHLLYTQENVLDDNIPEERNLGIESGLEWGLVAQATVVYTDYGISNGMTLGMQRARMNNRPIEMRTIGVNP